MFDNLSSFNFFKIFIALLLFSSLPSKLYSQVPEILSEEFLAGLPPSVRDEIEVKNKVNEGLELENLFRSETSLEKNKVILKNLKDQLTALEQRFAGDDSSKTNVLPIFGQSFFSTLQSSFMPVNVPNLGSNYIVDVGDTFTLMTIGKINQEYELMVQRGRFSYYS